MLILLAAVVALRVIMGLPNDPLSILTMIFAFPQRLDGVAWISSLIKITKFGSAAVGVPLIVIPAVILVWKRTVGCREQRSRA